MAGADDTDAMAQACIDACAAVLAHGTPELKVVARVLLAVLGRELAERVSAQTATSDEKGASRP